VIGFSWHGGEPTLLGLDYFHKIVELQRRHQPRGRRIVNGIQTNGTLLDEKWCRFLSTEEFGVESAWTARRICTTATVLPAVEADSQAGHARI